MRRDEAGRGTRTSRARARVKHARATTRCTVGALERHGPDVAHSKSNLETFEQSHVCSCSKNIQKGAACCRACSRTLGVPSVRARVERPPRPREESDWLSHTSELSSRSLHAPPRLATGSRAHVLTRSRAHMLETYRARRVVADWSSTLSAALSHVCSSKHRTTL